MGGKSRTTPQRNVPRSMTSSSVSAVAGAAINRDAVAIPKSLLSIVFLHVGVGRCLLCLIKIEYPILYPMSTLHSQLSRGRSNTGDHDKPPRVIQDEAEGCRHLENG